MDRTVEIHPERKLVVTSFIGPIDYNDIIKWIDDLQKHESFSIEYDGVVDLRNAVFKKTRMEKVELLASYMIERNFTKGKWAILVTTPVETALSLLYSQIASQQHPIKSFSTVEAAAEFLSKDLEGIGL